MKLGEQVEVPEYLVERVRRRRLGFDRFRRCRERTTKSGVSALSFEIEVGGVGAVGGSGERRGECGVAGGEST